MRRLLLVMKVLSVYLGLLRAYLCGYLLSFLARLVKVLTMCRGAIRVNLSEWTLGALTT